MEEQRRRVVEAEVRDEGVVSALSPASESYLAKGFGRREGKQILYTAVEALYLVEEGRMRVRGEDGEELDFNQLLSLLRRRLPNLWMDYVVYRDLRKRRYVVKEGFGEELRFRVFERGEYGEKAARYVVAPLYEGRDITVERIKKWMQACRNMRKELILAVVDRRNEVIYYRASLVDLRNV